MVFRTFLLNSPKSKLCLFGYSTIFITFEKKILVLFKVKSTLFVSKFVKLSSMRSMWKILCLCWMLPYNVSIFRFSKPYQSGCLMLQVILDLICYLKLWLFHTLLWFWLFQHSDLQSDLKTMSLQRNYTLFVSLSLQIINRFMINLIYEAY